MYVRRWPRISASSRTPPSDMRTNSRPVARAIDSPIDVLPVPGGPISVRIAPDALVLGDAALLAQLAHGDVLGDAVLDVLEARVVGVQHLARVHRVEPLVGALRPRHGRPASRGRCGSSTPRPTARPSARGARARCSACSRTSSGMPASSILVRYSSATEPSSSPSSLRIDSICLRRKYSRCCFSAPDCTSSRMRLRTCSSASRSRWSASACSSRSVTSSVSSSSTFCSKAQVRRVAGGVGQRAGLGDRAHERAIRPSSPRSSRISSTTARYSRSSSRVRPSTGSSSGARRPRRAGRRRRPCCAAPATPRCRPVSATARPPPGSRMRSTTSATVPTLANSPLVARDEQHALLVADVDGQRRRSCSGRRRVVHRHEYSLSMSFFSIGTYVS